LKAGKTVRTDAVIWDFGGVLTSSPFEAFARYERQSGLPENFIRQVNSVNPDTNAWALFERAEIDAATFDALFTAESTALGHKLAGDLRPGAIAALKALKGTYRLGCITNNVPVGHGAGMAGTLEKAQAVGEVMTIFDHVIESSKIGIRKPDPRIYQLMCETLQVDPAACIYLDDLGINLKPAKAMGMRTIKVTSEAQLLEELGALLGRTWD
jgi:putative hydrolase of the HAD superfamily